MDLINTYVETKIGDDERKMTCWFLNSILCNDFYLRGLGDFGECCFEWAICLMILIRAILLWILQVWQCKWWQLWWWEWQGDVAEWILRNVHCSRQEWLFGAHSSSPLTHLWQSHLHATTTGSTSLVNVRNVSSNTSLVRYIVDFPPVDIWIIYVVNGNKWYSSIINLRSSWPISFQ